MVPKTGQDRTPDLSDVGQFPTVAAGMAGMLPGVIRSMWNGDNQPQ